METQHAQDGQHEEQDAVFLQAAVDLARSSLGRADGGPFGAVIVRQGAIIAQGWNRVVANHDPTAHAEILAIRQACHKLKRFHLEDCTLYASSEPCPMCLAAAYWAKIGRIVFANSRQQAAAIGFSDETLYGELQRPISARHIPTRHLPLPDAEEPLRQWHGNPQRIAY